jgi:hypothetical protein
MRWMHKHERGYFYMRWCSLKSNSSRTYTRRKPRVLGLAEGRLEAIHSVPLSHKGPHARISHRLLDIRCAGKFRVEGERLVFRNSNNTFIFKLCRYCLWMYIGVLL